MDLLGKLHLFRQKVIAASRWLEQVRACWLGDSTAARLVLWLSAGVILAKELALPPYLTWMAAVLWLVVGCLRLFLTGGELRPAVL